MPEFRIALVLGGARSGKSRFAETLAKSTSATNFVYVATAEARDDEMRERIARHRARRGGEWKTVEETLDLAQVIERATARDFVLIDCLTLWLSNVLLAGRSVCEDVEILRAAIARASGQIVLVTNEVGQGIVPENALARRFRDEAGLLNQSIAQIADHVVFMAAGLPIVLKGALLSRPIAPIP